MMAFFDELFVDPAKTRLTGIRLTDPRADDRDDAELAIHVVTVPEHLDAATELGFLERFMPFSVGGIVGRLADGGEWMILFQHLSDHARVLAGDGAPLTFMQVSLDRALALSPDLVLDDSYDLSDLDLRGYYVDQGINAEVVGPWTTRTLLRGLVADLCGFPLTAFATTYAHGCAFPEVPHDCQHDTADDVFAQWTQAGRLSPADPAQALTAALPIAADETLFDEPEAASEPEVAVDPEPAGRFVNAQSWWIASEIARRHPQLIIHEMHPGGGMYDVLGIMKPGGRESLAWLNRTGRICVATGDDRSPSDDDSFQLTWTDVMAMASPHTAVKAIEVAAGLVLTGKAPASTPRTLAYRVIANVINSCSNDRHHWDVRNEFIDSSSDDDGVLNGYLDAFPEARSDSARTPRLGLWHEPESHFWAVLRDDEPVALISIEAALYLPGKKPIDMMAEYKRHGRRIIPCMASLLGDLLP
ncbi:hypothetical protein SAMN05216410_3016 [Sanguibacter gelidistatuariae]|uniref:T3SS peptide-binding chaperone domain-containing protein n=1 Tax=Sanguibacter gelidistatuariae TaxID=1814289 RepID=A0A1G6T5S9_9MICO|nr:hypothetical protein [Sanguibacter gelidistatuariae]SDD23886.1 hypothetical protein SAMN05216410_3016 [Sanguibacter gelidistatuariae]